MATFIVTYDVSKYQLHESQDMQNLANRIREDLESVIGGEKITETASLVDISTDLADGRLTPSEEDTITSGDALEIIWSQMEELTNEYGSLKYTEQDLEPVRLLVARAHNDQVSYFNSLSD